MKRILAAIALAALITGCDSKPDAPFGLKWGQSMDSVSFIKDGDCEKEGGVTTCTFDNQRPFNEWTFSNELKFDRDGLVEIVSAFVGIEDHGPSFKNFKDKLNNETEFLLVNGFDREVLNKIKQRCEDSDTCDKTNERAKLSIGNTSLWITTESTKSPIGIVTFTR
ncbi:hypothetical protein M2263_001800 [Providencia alcalifaciens]|nr:hypothetical protein [Providencia alcalifaciens]